MTAPFSITIHHNPDCGTSRNTLAMIRAAGYEPVIVQYLQTGWTRPQLTALLSAMGMKPRDIMREKGTPAAALGLRDAAVSDDQILDAMIAHPVLVNRRPGQVSGSCRRTLSQGGGWRAGAVGGVLPDA